MGKSLVSFLQNQSQPVWDSLCHTRTPHLPPHAPCPPRNALPHAPLFPHAITPSPAFPALRGQPGARRRPPPLRPKQHPAAAISAWPQPCPGCPGHPLHPLVLTCGGAGTLLFGLPCALPGPAVGVYKGPGRNFWKVEKKVLQKMPGEGEEGEDPGEHSRPPPMAARARPFCCCGAGGPAGSGGRAVPRSAGAAAARPRQGPAAGPGVPGQQRGCSAFRGLGTIFIESRRDFG